MTPGQEDALDLSRDLARVLDRARDLARAGNLTRELGLGLARALELDRDLNLDIATARGILADLDRALSRDLALASASGLDHTLGRDLDLDLALGRDLELALALASDLDIASTRAPTFDRDLASARTRARSLAYELQLLRDRVAELERTQWTVPPGPRSAKPAQTRPVALSARRLAVAAAWLLPAGDRARYGEEYRSELWDLAHAGAGRRQQVGYAFRQFVRAVPMRQAVLAPRGKRQPGLLCGGRRPERSWSSRWHWPGSVRAAQSIRSSSCSSW
jgi:hypothetical protein